MRRKLIAGNWKMNGARASIAELSKLEGLHPDPASEILICPPVTLLAAFEGKTSIPLGAQDCHWETGGAHTGDISAEMLKEAGAQAVILGHSERRTDHGETDADVARKTEAAWRAGLLAIVCIGETEAERDAGETLTVIRQQLQVSLPQGATAENTVIAYEPVWAIGTGRTPTLDQVAEVHDDIRASLEGRLGAEIAGGIRLLYGGSVKPANAAAIFEIANVDGGLIGGASLKAEDFAGIVAAAETQRSP